MTFAFEILPKFHPPFMKISRLFVFVVALMTSLSAPLHAAQAPKLETLLGEYAKARTDVLGKLNESYAVQADALAARLQAIPNLDGADRARSFAKRLRDADQNNEAIGASETGNASDPVAMLQTNYSQARTENLKNVYTFYTTAAGNLRRELLKENDKPGAEVLTTFLEKIKPAATPTPSSSPAKKRKMPAK
jgi:hypothetical protein